jgi:Flp pilus assembly protein TadD
MATKTKSRIPASRDELTEQANQLLQANKLAEAFPILKQLAELEDASPHTCTTAGLVGLTLERTVEARQLFERALAIAPDDFDSRYNLFLLEMVDKAPEKALLQLNRLIELYPDNANLYNDRAVLAMDRESHTEVLQDLTKAVQLEPNARKPIECGLAYFTQKGLNSLGQQFVETIRRSEQLSSRTSQLLEQWNKKLTADS